MRVKCNLYYANEWGGLWGGGVLYYPPNIIMSILKQATELLSYPTSPFRKQQLDSLIRPLLLLFFHQTHALWHEAYVGYTINENLLVIIILNLKNNNVII